MTDNGPGPTLGSVDEVLVGISAKLRRAQTLIGELQQLDLAYLSSDPVKHSVVADSKRSRYLVDIQVVRQPPTEMATVFGDSLHNLRASLDYLARGLVIANGGVPVDSAGGRSTMFPIRKQRPTAGLTIQPAISEGANLLLDSVQPYTSETPHSHPLALLDDLENRDKHRLLNVGKLSGSVAAVFIPASLDPPSRNADDPTHKLTIWDGEPQIVTVPPREFIPEPRLVGMWSWTTVLAERGPSWHNQVTGLALTISNHVVDVLNLFRPHLTLGEQRSP
jgi:hypothetical protein